MATIFGALYVRCCPSCCDSGTAPAVATGAPAAWLGAERGWILLLVLAVWSYDTGAYLVGGISADRF
jgi:CDP-diglyceride synthetase